MVSLPTELHGLTIAADDDPREAEVRWDRRTCDVVGPQRRTTAYDEGGWTHLVFATADAAHCRFAVSPDGRRVVSHALPGVRDSTLFGLFAEPVMRVIFHRRRIVSFHGSAVARGGVALLLIGDRGAGKSSLGGALIRNGWSLLADDLVRPVPDAHGWRIPPGYRRAKFLPDTAAALGYDPATLAPRWNIGDAPAMGNKLLVDPPATPPEPARLHAIWCLGARRPGTAEPRVVTMDPADRLRTLLRHVTRGLGVPAAPPAAAFAVAAALIRDTLVAALEVPDDLQALVAVAATLGDRLTDERDRCGTEEMETM